MTETPTRITVYPDGPLIVRGTFVVDGVDGTPVTEPARTIALCRCGRSALKPLCDGSHARANARTSRRRADRDDA